MSCHPPTRQVGPYQSEDGPHDELTEQLALTDLHIKPYAQQQMKVYADITISRRGRAGFAAGDLLSGTTEEKARAVEGFVAYAGRYSFHGDRVVHHVELSLFPNWVASDQERWVELAEDRLTLSASPLLLAGKLQVPRLVWERVDSSPNRG
jgi:hypothetical protein